MKKKLVLLGLILLLGIGFASVTTTLYLNGDINISANSEDFDVKFTKAVIDNEDRTNTTISVDGKTINFTTKELRTLNDKSVLDFEVTNNSSLYDAEISIECTSGEKGEYYQITKGLANSIAAKKTETGKVEVEKIRMTEEDIEEVFTCTLNAVARERTVKGEEVPKVNKNIEKAYVYDAINCVTGEEPTCVETTCYNDIANNSCLPGTIIKYRVNDSIVKYFHVLHDDGGVMTLQQRENTVSGTAWYADSDDNTKGPLTILPALENATNGWINVNTLNYTMGTTVLKNNSYTGCSSYNLCDSNVYKLEARSGKARMITIQETAALGCTLTDISCPNWVNNFLYESTSYGGTVNYGGDWGYWTMNAYSLNSAHIWLVSRNGHVHSNTTSNPYSGARAVIEVNKYV